VKFINCTCCVVALHITRAESTVESFCGSNFTHKKWDVPNTVVLSKWGGDFSFCACIAAGIKCCHECPYWYPKKVAMAD